MVLKKRRIKHIAKPGDTIGGPKKKKEPAPKAEAPKAEKSKVEKTKMEKPVLKKKKVEKPSEG